jgi:hypothetical protein
VQTTCFDFSQQLYNLVADRALFGTLHNLDFNINDPFGDLVMGHDQVSGFCCIDTGWTPQEKQRQFQLLKENHSYV